MTTASGLALPTRSKACATERQCKEGEQDMAYETLTIAIAALAAVAIVTMAALRGWQGYLALRMQEIGRTDDRSREAVGEGMPAARIELAALKERVRQLEAIAAGVEL